MAERGNFQGYGLQPVDDKGRVAIPAALRVALEANTPARDDGKEARQVVISTHEDSRCLIGYDVGYGLTLRDEAAARARIGAAGEIDYNLQRKVMGAAEQLPFDASGRFILPAFPRFHAGIEGHAFFYGVGHYFEIWNPRTLVETVGAPDVMVSAARFFMAQKGIAL